MPDKEEALEVKMHKTNERLKAAAGYMVTLIEPLHVLQRLKWESLALRAELTALRDMLRAKGALDTAEYQKRTQDEMEKYISLIEREMNIQVGEDGKFIMNTKSSDALVRGKGIIQAQ